MTHVTQCIAVLCISLQDFLRRWSFRANLAEMEYDPEAAIEPQSRSRFLHANSHAAMWRKACLDRPNRSG